MALAVHFFLPGRGGKCSVAGMVVSAQFFNAIFGYWRTAIRDGDFIICAFFNSQRHAVAIACGRQLTIFVFASLLQNEFAVFLGVLIGGFAVGIMRRGPITSGERGADADGAESYQRFGKASFEV